MKVLQIEGCQPLYGELEVSGSKNAALPILFATILTNDECLLRGVPDIADVRNAVKILRSLGASVEWRGSTLAVNTRMLTPPKASVPEADRLRGSLYLLGAMLGNFGETVLLGAGGCDFGVRPIDYHLAAFCKLGASVKRVSEEGAVLQAATLRGGDIVLPKPSVGATVNSMLAAVKAKGSTRIIGAAREPHVVDTARFLQSCGARISGAGESCICIEGVCALHGATHTVIPDMIEAGTFLTMGAACGGEISIRDANPEELTEPLRLLAAMGNEVRIEKKCIRLRRKKPLTGISLHTSPYPGFPTDLQPQFGALLTLSRGGGTVTETVFDNRFRYAEQLRRMGAHMILDGKNARFRGGDKLRGAVVEASDLRAGAALAIAALAAEGKSFVHNYSLIERGYECFAEKICLLGGKAELTETSTAGESALAEDAPQSGNENNGTVKK